MKIALLTKYGGLAASTRQRFQQYSHYLELAGFEIELHPLLDDAYLEELYASGRRDRAHLIARYFKRFRWLMSKPDIDVIWLHCELFPYLPGLFERLARWPGKSIVFDYDDAIFHNYDLHPNPVIRSVLGSKLYTTISGAELAICGNAYLAEYARVHCPRIEIVPTVVNAEVYYPLKAGAERSSDDCPRIGWIGTPSTWREYLLPMLPMLTEAAQAGGGQVAVMGADRQTIAQPLLETSIWSEAGEVPFLQAMDIGIMPLTDTPWARGKCGYKLIQYMACGLPVIVSPVGVNTEIVEHGVNGFLATTDADWREALVMLLRDPDLRIRMGAAGRRKVEEQYSLQVWGPRVADMLSKVAREHIA
jgi:hypothetical protein